LISKVAVDLRAIRSWQYKKDTSTWIITIIQLS
jgi:hypothetical protein